MEDKEESEEKEVDENIILVTTYQTQHSSYFTVCPFFSFYLQDLFLPQLNAGKIPSRQMSSVKGLPEGVLIPSSSSLDPVPLFRRDE